MKEIHVWVWRLYLLWQYTGHPRLPWPDRNQLFYRAGCPKPTHWQPSGPDGCSSSSQCKPCLQQSETTGAEAETHCHIPLIMHWFLFNR